MPRPCECGCPPPNCLCEAWWGVGLKNGTPKSGGPSRPLHDSASPLDSGWWAGTASHSGEKKPCQRSWSRSGSPGTPRPACSCRRRSTTAVRCRGRRGRRWGPPARRGCRCAGGGAGRWAAGGSVRGGAPVAIHCVKECLRVVKQRHLNNICPSYSQLQKYLRHTGPKVFTRFPMFCPIACDFVPVLCCGLGHIPYCRIAILKPEPGAISMFPSFLTGIPQVSIWRMSGTTTQQPKLPWYQPGKKIRGPRENFCTSVP